MCQSQLNIRSNEASSSSTHQLLYKPGACVSVTRERVSLHAFMHACSWVRPKIKRRKWSGCTRREGVQNGNRAGQGGPWPLFLHLPCNWSPYLGLSLPCCGSHNTKTTRLSCMSQPSTFSYSSSCCPWCWCSSWFQILWGVVEDTTFTSRLHSMGPSNDLGRCLPGA